MRIRSAALAFRKNSRASRPFKVGIALIAVAIVILHFSLSPYCRCHCNSPVFLVASRYTIFFERLLYRIAIDSVTLHRLAAVSSKPPYRFRSRGTRDPTDAATGGLVLRSFSEGGCPPMTVSLFYWPCPFIVSFHDLRSVCHDADETGLYIVRFG